MAAIVNTFFFLTFLSLSLQPQLHARNTKFFTNLIHYNLFNTLTISASPTRAPAPKVLEPAVMVPAPAPMELAVIVPAPAPMELAVIVPAPAPMEPAVMVPALAPMVLEPAVIVPAPAPMVLESAGIAPAAPVEQEYGYGHYGRGLSEFSTKEDQPSSTLVGGSKNIGTPAVEMEEDGGPAADQYFTPTENEAPFEKLVSSESYSTNINGNSNNDNGFSTSMNQNNGYSSSMNQNNGYNNQNMYSNNGDEYSSSMNQNNAYTPERYSYNGNGYGYTRLKEDNLTMATRA